MNYTLDGIEDPNYKVLSQLWTNTFILETKVDEGNFIFSYYQGSNYSKIYTVDRIIYVVKDTTFFNENLSECQVNYCSISSKVATETEPDYCFKTLILENPSFEGVSDQEIYYVLYSLSDYTSNKIYFKNSIPLISENYTNNQYTIQVFRDDKLGKELLFQKNFIFTNLAYESQSLKYQDNFFSFSFSSICKLDENKFTLGNSVNEECNPVENKYNCKYSIKSELNKRYELLYDNVYIDSFSFITDFLYEVNHSVI